MHELKYTEEKDCNQQTVKDKRDLNFVWTTVVGNGPLQPS